jgi:hypothetical protein
MINIPSYGRKLNADQGFFLICNRLPNRAGGIIRLSQKLEPGYRLSPGLANPG